MSELGLVPVRWVMYYIAALEHIIHTHFKLLLFPRYIFPWNRQINFETRLEYYCSFDIAKICKFGGKYSVKTGPARSCPIYVYSGFFKGHRATFKVTSVAGHVFNRDFPSNFQDWRMDPVELFDAPTVRKLDK